MNAIRTSLFIVSLLFACTLSAQKKEKFNEKEYTTRAGIVLKAGETHTLGNTSGKRFTAIMQWFIGSPNKDFYLDARYVSSSFTIIKFKKDDDVVFALFEIGGIRYGIAVESAIVKGELIISKEVK